MNRSIVSIFMLTGSVFAQNVFVIDIKGMTCKLCHIAVKKTLISIKGAKRVKTSLKSRIAVVISEDSVSEKDLLEACEPLCKMFTLAL